MRSIPPSISSPPSRPGRPRRLQLPSAVARWLIAAALAIAAMLAGAAPASAALPVTFDGLSPGTSVSTQFAGDGITFLDPPGTSGRPVVAEVGTRANSGSRVATATCPGCEFEDRYMLMQLSTLAETASVRIGIDTDGGAGSGPLRLEALNAAQTVIGQTDATISTANFKTLMTVDPPGAQTIAFLRIRGTNGVGWTFGIDDVNYTAAPTVDPDFAIAPGGAIRLRQGGTATVPVDVLRFNGSTGNVNLTGTSLPAGVSASFTPTAVGGSTTAASTMTLTASPTASLGTTFDAGVRGAPATPSVGPAERIGRYTLTVERAFEFSSSLADATITPCGPAVTGSLYVNRARAGFPGTVALSVEGTPGYAATIDESSLLPTGDGTNGHVVGISIRATSSAILPTGEITVRATSPGVTDQTVVIPVRRDLGSVDGMAPTTGTTPWNRRPGTLVRVEGRGFCDGSTVEFGSGQDRAIAESVAPDGTWLTVRVPRLATTGPLTVRNPGRGIVGLGTFTVLSPRSTQGFKFENFDHPGVDLATVTQLYGETQTQISFDPCNPAPGLIPPICPIPTGIPNPLTAVYMGISDAALAGNGSCFGIAVTAEHIATGQAPIAGFAPAGSANAWQLDAVGGPGAALAQRIRTWHTSQLSSSYLGYWIDNAAANVSNGGRGSRTTIVNELAAGRHPIVALRNGGSGHVLVAHNLRDGPNPGEYEVDVYDPNVPFVVGELTDGGTNTGNENASIIRVSAGGGWTFQGGFAPIWSGGSDGMVVAPLSVLGTRPVMPTDPFGVVSLLVPLASSAATVAQVEDGGGRKLLGTDGNLNPDPATRPAKGTIAPTLTGVDSRPLYALAAGDRSKVSLVGTADGTAGTAVMAPGFAAEVSGLRTTKGSTDELELASKSGQLSVDASRGGNVEANLARELKGGDQIGAKVEIVGGDRGEHELRLAGGSAGLRYVNQGSGPARLKTTLSWAGKKGTPGETTLPTLSIPKGGSVQSAPTSWGKLGESPVRLVVKDRRGKVVRRVSHRPRVVRRVSNLKVSVKTLKSGERQASVRVRFRSVPKAAKVAIGIYGKQGKNLVATDTLDVAPSKARGTKTYRFTVDLPKGKTTLYGTATVTDGGKVSAARGKRTVNVK